MARRRYTVEEAFRTYWPSGSHAPTWYVRDRAKTGVLCRCDNREPARKIARALNTAEQLVKRKAK